MNSVNSSTKPYVNIAVQPLSDWSQKKRLVEVLVLTLKVTFILSFS